MKLPSNISIVFLALTLLHSSYTVSSQNKNIAPLSCHVPEELKKSFHEEALNAFYRVLDFGPFVITKERYPALFAVYGPKVFSYKCRVYNYGTVFDYYKDFFSSATIAQEFCAELSKEENSMQLSKECATMLPFFKESPSSCLSQEAKEMLLNATEQSFKSTTELSKRCATMFPSAAFSTAISQAKLGWQAAYNGDFGIACHFLTRAVEEDKDLVSCAFLAHSYRHNGLVTGYDANNADDFEKLTQELKQEKKDEIWQLERKVNRKTEFIEAAADTCSYRWYEKATSLLFQNWQPPTWKQKKKFRVPPIKKGVEALLNRHDAPSDDDNFWPLIQEGIQDERTSYIGEIIVNWFNKDTGHYNCHSSVTYRSQYRRQKGAHILPILHEWCMRNNKKKELSTAYKTYINDVGGWRNKKDENNVQQADNDTVAVFPSYYSVDPKESLIKLKSIIHHKVHYLASYNISDSLLKYLICAQKLNPPLFEKYAQQILTEKLDGMLARAVTYPLLMEQLEDSSLSINQLIHTAATKAIENEGERPYDAYKIFLKDGKDLHARYQTQIESHLSVLLEKHPLSIDREAFGLLQSPIPSLRQSTFAALTAYLTNPASERYTVELIVKYLLKEPLENIFNETSSKIDAYCSFNQTCHQRNAILPLQLLWKHLSKKIKNKDANDPHKLLLEQSVCSFFGTDSPMVESNNSNMPFSFADLLNKAIRESSKDVAQLNRFMIAASQTKIAHLLAPEVKEHLKGIAIVNQDTPLKVRCACLSDLIVSRLAQKQSYQDIVNNVNTTIEDGSFKKYALTIFSLLEPTNSLYKHFATLKTLKTMYHQNNNLDFHTKVIHSVRPYFLNVLSPYYSQQIEETPGYKTIHSLANAQLINNLLIGYLNNERTYGYDVQKGFQLYGCDAVSGDIIWGTLAHFQQPKQFIAHSNHVYCLTDDNWLLKINQEDGTIERQFNISNLLDPEDAISKFHISPHQPHCINKKCDDESHNTVFISAKNKKPESIIAIFNLNDPSNSAKVLRSKDTLLGLGLIGDKIALHSTEQGKAPQKLRLFYPDNQSVEAPFSPPLVGKAPMVGNQEAIFYAQPDSRGELNQIVCFDCNTKKIRWNHSVAHEDNYIKKIKLSRNDNALFVITSSELWALNVNNTSDAERVLWRKNIHGGFDSDITSIVEGNDGTLYGIDEHVTKEFLSFDGKTGTRKVLGTLPKMSANRLVGIKDGTFYIQPSGYL